MSEQTEPATEPEAPPPVKTAAKRTRRPRTPRTQAAPGLVRNESDVALYYPTLGVTLGPGESFTPKPEE